MLRPIYVILCLFWVMGMVTAHTWGGALHVLLVMLLMMDLFRVWVFSPLDMKLEIS